MFKLSLTSIISLYGYPALFIGTFLEGETILVIAGFLAHKGILFLPWVILFAFLGSFAGDQLFFFIGRKKGISFFEKRENWKPKIEKASRLIEKYNTWLIVGFRFLYGVRTVTPFMIGTTTVPVKRFFILNMIGAIIWAIAVGFLGYLFGRVFEDVLGNIKQFELWGIVAMIAIAGLIKLYQHFSNRKSTVEQD